MAGGGRTAGDLLEAKAAAGPLLTVSSHDEVGQALALMQHHGLSQVPVVSAEDESAFVGVVSERGLLWASAEHPGILKQEVTEVLEPPLPELAPEDPAEDVIKLLEEGRQAVIVMRAGNPLGILTPLDLIEVLNR